MIKVIIAFIALSMPLFAQAPPSVQPQPTPTVPTNWYGLGAAYNASTAQGVNHASGWAGYGHNMDTKIPLWQFDLYSVYLVKGSGKTQVVTATTGGAAIGIRTIGPINILAFGTVGMAVSGSNIGNVFPFGGFIDVRLGKSMWHFDAGYQQIPSSLSGVQTQKVPFFGIGRMF
jgi:hypothetical protein